MRFFLLVVLSSSWLSYGMSDNTNNNNNNGFCSEVAMRYCCGLLTESLIARYSERQPLVNSGNIQQSPSLEERTCRACCARHWGKMCCCCSCCCVSVTGGAIAFAGGIKAGVDAMKGTASTMH